MYLRSCDHVVIANLVLVDIYTFKVVITVLMLLLQFFHLSLHVLFLFSHYAHASYILCWKYAYTQRKVKRIYFIHNL